MIPPKIDSAEMRAKIVRLHEEGMPPLAISATLERGYGPAAVKRVLIESGCIEVAKTPAERDVQTCRFECARCGETKVTTLDSAWYANHVCSGKRRAAPKTSAPFAYPDITRRFDTRIAPRTPVAVMYA